MEGGGKRKEGWQWEKTRRVQMDGHRPQRCPTTLNKILGSLFTQSATHFPIATLVHHLLVLRMIGTITEYQRKM